MTKKIKTQYAALPFRLTADGVKICLISGKGSGQWIIPKGWPSKRLPPHKLATLRAFEEAGLEGAADKKTIGRYRAKKRMSDGSTFRYEVIVFPMLVDWQVRKWPQKDQRSSRWVTLKKASKLVGDKEFAELLKHLTPRSFVSSILTS